VFPDPPARPDAPPSAEDLARLWEGTNGLLAIARYDGRIEHVNRAWEAALGWTPAELVGRSLAEFVHPEDVDITFATMASSRDTGIDDFEFRCRTRAGSWRHLTWRAECHEDRWFCIAHDSTRRHELEQDVLRDSLTGVLNRAACLDRLAHALARAERGGGPIGVLFIDLDGFKSVNDSLGHAVGDAVLSAVARRLDDVLRRSDSLARLGGDEFVVLAENISGADEVDLLSTRIREALQEPIAVEDGSVTLGASIGVVLAEGGSAVEALRQADVALYRAKADGRDRAVWFDATLREEVEGRQRLGIELRGVAGRDELRLHYQPIVSLRDQSATGCEALLRWKHPTRGLLAPAAFLEIAEQDGVIVEIGSWALEQACRQQRRWRRGGRDVMVSVNVSARELLDPRYADRVAQIIATTSADAHSLTLEVTETALLTETSGVARTLESLHGIGVRIALDDFGRGYSSLEHLKALPVDVIKIDHAFVAGIAEGVEDRAIVAAMIALARTTGRTVIAEGIETESQLLELVELGCPLGQGYYFAGPIRPADLDLDGFVPQSRPGVGDPTAIREFMRQIGIPARIR